jgi:hypothetical protein
MGGPRKFSRWYPWSAALYCVLAVVIVWSQLAARHWALVELATPQSTADWEAWRAEVRAEQDQATPVRRAVPKSSEPPALVLMRDYFGVSLAGAVLFSSVLYWILAWLLHGILTPSPTANSRIGPDETEKA